jgi:hypothetical protein
VVQTDNDANGGADSNEAELKQKAITGGVRRGCDGESPAVTTVVTTIADLVTVETATVPLVETSSSRSGVAGLGDGSGMQVAVSQQRPTVPEHQFHAPHQRRRR